MYSGTFGLSWSCIHLRRTWERTRQATCEDHRYLHFFCKSFSPFFCKGHLHTLLSQDGYSTACIISLVGKADTMRSSVTSPTLLSELHCKHVGGCPPFANGHTLWKVCALSSHRPRRLLIVVRVPFFAYPFILLICWHLQRLAVGRVQAAS